MAGQFVISLDFELLWGVRDNSDKAAYGQNVLGARDAVPHMLELFAARDIRATWATVGFLFCETKDELMASLPAERLTYTNPRLSNYTYLDEVGKDERSDPRRPVVSELSRQRHRVSHETGVRRRPTEPDAAMRYLTCTF